ncbi:hypothetical protein V7S43_003573 [Phytophthora oleae]|uniref:BED-type domain-containing protein n=1 Tax=Phytophthora oleae TaxID=2107226 RepID=A0ABD3FZ18_9STRA
MDMDATFVPVVRDTDTASTVSSIGSSRRCTRKNESPVFDYINELSTGEFQCMVCARAGETQIWRSCSTSNFKGHLANRHAEIYEHEVEGQRSGTFSRQTRARVEVMTPEAAKNCDEKLVDGLCQTPSHLLLWIKMHSWHFPS